MKHRKKLIACNILIPIIMFILVLVTGLTSSFMNIVTFTLVVGWAIPYLALVLTGLAIFNKSHRKLSLTLNIFNVLLSLVLITFVICIIEKALIIILIEYIIMLVMSIINIIAIIKDMKANPDLEIEEINKTKLENNGIIK